MENNSSPTDSTIDSYQPGKDRWVTCTGIRRFIGRFRIRTVLITSLVLILVSSMGLTGLIAFQNSQYVVSEISSQLQDEISTRIDSHLDNYLKVPHLINELCSNSIRLGEIQIHDTEGLKRHFQELSYQFNSVEAICYGNEGDGNYSIISLVGKPGVVNGTDRFWAISPVSSANFSYEEYRIDRRGHIVEKTLSYPQYDPRTRNWYKTAVQAGGPVWTPIAMWLEVEAVSVDAVSPVYSEEGVLLGVLDTSLTLNGIGDFLQALQISKTGQAFIIEKSGLLVSSSTIRDPYTRKNGELIRLSALDCNDVIRGATQYIITHGMNQTNLTSRQDFSFDIGGERQFVQVTPYQDNYGLEWLIVVVIPESDFMADINANNQLTILMVVCAIVGTTLISILLAQWITEPIIQLNKSARALARGDWRSWADLDRHDELGELSHSFKMMADQLRISFSSVKASEERYMSLFQSSSDAILLFDGLSLLNINHAGEVMFGISREDAEGKDIDGPFGNVGCSIREMIESSQNTPNGNNSDYTISRGGGDNQQFLNIRLMQVPEGKKFLNLIQIRDITDQRRAYMLLVEQEALRESYSHIQTILQFLPDPTFVIDTNGCVLFWNQAIENMTGLKAEYIKGKGDYLYSEAIHNKKRKILIDIALHPETPREGMYAYVEQSGDLLKTSFWVEISGEMKFLSIIAAPIYDKDGKVTGAIESIRDITSHKIDEEALLIANKKLTLLSTITSHDIMNKVSLSKTFLMLLGESHLQYEQKESVDAIIRSMDAIDHFIAFTRTYQELGQKIPVWQDIEEVFRWAAQGVEKGDVEVNIEVQGISILADPLLEKVCYNLIENAIRHGESATRVSVTAYDINEGIRISVEDNGCGIPDDQKDVIFERGYGKNTGYGLFLTREILLMSEITIAERGQFGTSCRFDIDVPFGKFKRDSTDKPD
ncbi:MAG TPA: PAS domain S-box protein [Methanospirillum sp.]|nr:PAS domain S-box protein [Methanospirillum sp.]